MVVNTIYTLEVSNITISGGEQLSGITQGNGSHLLGETITLNNNSFTTVDVNDSDDTNFDDSDGSQTLDSAITYGGTPFAAGLVVESEYALTVEDPAGSQYTLLAFNINEGGGPSFSTVEGLAFVGPVDGFPPIGVPLTVVDNDEGPSDPFASLATPSCFTNGCMIATPNGERQIEDLSVGDIVLTADNDAQTIRWIGRSKFSASQLSQNPKLRPVRIVAQALGHGLPKRDLLVSRQHRFVLNSKIANRMFHQNEVLISAIKMTELPGIFVDESVTNVEYIHILFDEHEIVYAEGASTESLFVGREALKSISPEARAEIVTIFPEISEQGFTPKSARYIPTGSSQKQLISRHLKNKKLCLSKRQ